MLHLSKFGSLHHVAKSGSKVAISTSEKGVDYKGLNIYNNSPNTTDQTLHVLLSEL